MKKLLLALLFLVGMSTLYGVDLSGRLGMGFGVSPDGYEIIPGELIPVIDIAVTRYGLSPTMAVEPIFQFTMVNVSDSTSANKIDFTLSGLLNFLVKGHKKTNIYGKAGLGFGFDKPYLETDETMFMISIPFGFGLEHFVSEHFSINLAAMSGFTFVSNPDNTSGSEFTIRLGNGKPFAFYLLWYY